MSKILHSFLLTAALLLALADARAQATNLLVSQVPVAPGSNGSAFSTQPKVTLRDGANATVTYPLRGPEEFRSILLPQWSRE